MKPTRKTPPVFRDVMIDLETLGQRPGCSILSIGAVAFDPVTGELGPELYTVVNRSNCLAASLYEDPDTIAWWEKQSEAARQVLRDADEGGERLETALLQLTEYLTQFGLKQVKIWGNGADFDNAILAVCYYQVGQDVPWAFWNNRCYRTLKSLIKGPSLSRQGTYHNALDDAKTQAQHAIQLLR